MKTCKLIILDQVNIKFEGLDPTTRRHLVDKMKIMVPYARHTPQFKMGRWDGKVPFATVGGGSYLNLLDEILPVLVANDYDIGSMEIEDRRIQPSFNFTEITDEFFADTLWPKGHPNEDEPIRYGCIGKEISSEVKSGVKRGIDSLFLCDFISNILAIVRVSIIFQLE